MDHIKSIIENSKKRTKLHRSNFIRKPFSKPSKRLSSSPKILMIGTGGIGCELLKNLLMCKFTSIDIVDLDTIELSNLNRQFLFRREDIGQSKALIAKTRSLEFEPAASISAHHCNIQSSRMGPPFFQGFDLVINALDNLPTRRHVNRICLAKNKLLLESGTQGYNGQVYLIEGGRTECYECVPKMTPKTFPVCTIRDTPSQPVHCVAWAKMMYESLFGPVEEKNDLSDMKITKSNSETNAEFSKRLFDFLFGDNIKSRLKNPVQNGQNPPQHTKILKNTPSPLYISHLNQLENVSTSQLNDNLVWDDKSHAKCFLETVSKILKLGIQGSAHFDKDDELAVDFVSSASNLRMANFHIPSISRFDVLGIAGNIVHAIATTNAICAGLLAIEASKILISGQKDESKRRWIQLNGGGSKAVIPEQLAPPNKSCYVCSKQTLDLICNVTALTLRQLFDQVLKKELGMVTPVVDVSCDNFISEDLDDWDGNQKWMDEYFGRPLSHEAVKIAHGSILSVSDDQQSFSADIVIVHCQNPADLIDTSADREDAKDFKLVKKRKFEINGRPLKRKNAPEIDETKRIKN